MAAFKTLDDISLAGRRVVIRVDLNVPVDKGMVRDATRIERVAPTIRELLDKGAAVIVLAHFERPKGKVVPEMSLRPLAPALADAVGRAVAFVGTDWRDGQAVQAAAAARPGTVTLMENTRFHPGEEQNDPGFARLLASLGEIYVDDAFSAAHRAHASTEGIAHYMPPVAGRAMQAELDALEKALGNPRRPLLAIVGGAKISTKLDLLANLTDKVDALAIGGAMANTFLAARGIGIGTSLSEPDLLDTARKILARAEKGKCHIILPLDAVVAKELKPGAVARTTALDAVPQQSMILDIGAETIAAVKSAIDAAATLVWNGPFGAFEVEPFARGTIEIAQYAAARTRARKLVSIAGGGDTVAALNMAGVVGDFTYVSTAGGAFLEWLEGKTLPGVEVLRSS